MRMLNFQLLQMIMVSAVLASLSLPLSASEPIPYLDWSYPEQSTVATYLNETIYYVDMKLDDSGTPHIIFLKDYEDRYAYYITHKDPESGNFTEPVLVYSTPENASWISTDGEYIVTELDHEANWHILFKYNDPNSSNSRLCYVYVVDGVVRKEQIVLERTRISGISDLARLFHESERYA